MKKILFLVCLCCVPYLVFSQRFPNSIVERVTVEGITYEVEKTSVSYYFDNVKNYKGDSPYIKLDGTPAGGTWADYDAGVLDKNAVERVIREVFTPQEIAGFKETDVYMMLYFVFDNQGKLVETAFDFDATAPVIAMPVARIAQFETRLKAEVTTRITDEATKELQFIQGIYGYSFKRMGDRVTIRPEAEGVDDSTLAEPERE
ncbi:hypothetical protein [uncultured Alistipes sp.]|uniref:hypothetical protein n=1 Tax=uncultured Alistipes sp. TaxID=538949 RepID=UPI0025CBB20D|nr:hypothetical protein [uncultured Alistipes sp.]